jgi:DNA-binding protein HU-beta
VRPFTVLSREAISGRLQPEWTKEIAMPSGKDRSPDDDASRATITLKQMATELADGHKLTKKQTEALLDDLMTLSVRHLKNDHKVRLTGLGLLHVQRPPPQRGLNLQTGEVIEIRGKGKIAFRAAKELGEIV